MTTTPISEAPRRSGLWALAIAVLAGVAAVVLWQRVQLALARPLWFDESWTLSLATTPDWRTFLFEAHNDVNPPLYYLAMRLWTALAGSSDLAVRLPGLLGAPLAALAAYALGPKALGRGGRLAWAAMLFGWWGVGVFLDGRCYGPLLALSTVQAIAFARLMEAPARRRAAAWCALACLAILTQYVAAVPAAAQGLVYLAVHRRRALATWPALLAFVPAAAWMAYHADQLSRFGQGAVAWHARVDASLALGLLAYVFGPVSALVLPLSIGALPLVGLIAGRHPPGEGPRPDRRLLQVFGAALLGLGLMLAVGALKPVLVARYLLPLAPGLLLGPVLFATRLRRPNLAFALLAAIYLATPLATGAFGQALRLGVPYGYETASGTLMAHGVRRVVFVWDHETAAIQAPASLARAGGVFFARARWPAQVIPLAPKPGQDVNQAALAAAQGPNAGIIWLYNRTAPTAARTVPPAIPALDPRWSCERAGDATIGTLACWR